MFELMGNLSHLNITVPQISEVTSFPYSCASADPQKYNVLSNEMLLLSRGR